MNTEEYNNIVLIIIKLYEVMVITGFFNLIHVDNAMARKTSHSITELTKN